MGVPKYFRTIIKKYPETHFWNANQRVDYLFLDYNALVHNSYRFLDSAVLAKKTDAQVENALIAEAVKYTQTIIQLAGPRQYVYIAVDGPVPRAKMHQQRLRRFGALKTEGYVAALRKQHKISGGVSWNKSANITPGTRFMTKLATALRKAAKAGKFGAEVKISDASVPGEGEHKFMPIIRTMKLEADDVVCIYGGDADLIVLSIASMRPNILIMREYEASSKELAEYEEIGFLYLSIDTFAQALLLEIKQDMDLEVEDYRVFLDYVFLTFMMGNDFVPHIPTLKFSNNAAHDGLNVLMRIYRRLLPEFVGKGRDYLVRLGGGANKKKNNQNGGAGTPQINRQFFKRLVDELAKGEDKIMKGQHREVLNSVKRGPPEHVLQREQDMDPFERDMARYEHAFYYHNINPFHKEYMTEFQKVDYSKPAKEWKAAYYAYFFELDPNNHEDYNSYRHMIATYYVDSLNYTLQYYLRGVPSWDWFYPFRVGPLPSDISYALHANRSADSYFEMGRPATPFEQLMYVLPTKFAKGILPKAYVKLMEGELLPYYPIDFELDMLAGGKNIYSEPVLPIVDASELERAIEDVKDTRTKAEIGRDTLTSDEFVYSARKSNN